MAQPGILTPDQYGPQLAVKSVRASTKMIRKMSSSPVLRLVSALTLPKESDAIRLGKAYGSDPTAVGKVFRKQNLKYGGGVGADLLPSEHAMFAFRDPLRALVTSYALEAGQTCTYGAEFSVKISGETNAFPFYLKPFQPFSGNVFPHGENLFLGRLGSSDQYRGIFLSAGSQLKVQTDPQPDIYYAVASSLIPEVYELRAGEWFPLVTSNWVIAAGGNFTYVVPRTGYYAITFRCNVSNAQPTRNIPDTFGVVSFDMSDVLTPMVWAQLPISNIEDILPVIKAIRTIGVSLMYTNTSGPLYRQGQITGIQLPKGSNFLDFFDRDEISSLAKSVTFDVVHGMYVFLKPTAVADLNMKPFILDAPYTWDNDEYLFTLYPESDYISIQARVDDANGRTGYLTHCASVEYESISQWSDLRVSEIDAQGVDTALRALSVIPQVHMNEFHVGDIWEWIKDAAGSVWKGVKEVASVAGPLLPIAAALL